MLPNYQAYFPQQRVDGAAKQKPEWYANCIDYVINVVLACNDIILKKKVYYDK